MRRSSDQGGGPSLRVSGAQSLSLRAGMRASRLRRASASAAAVPVSAGAGADLARRSPCARPGFDPLTLVRRLPSVVSALCEVRVGKGRLFEGLGFGASKRAMGSDSRWFQACLRGGVVVLSGALGGDVRDEGVGSGGGGRGKSVSSLVDSPRVGGGAPILGLFSVVGAIITRGKGTATGSGSTGPSVRVERPALGKDVVTLRFSDVLTAEKWEVALRAASAARQPVVSDFEFISPIGKGASGKVFLVRDRISGERFALKVVPKSKVFETRSGYRHAMDERLALENVAGCDFFTQLRYAFQTQANLYFVMEFCEGGDLYQHLKSQGGRVPEGAVRAILCEVIVAMEHFHRKNFVYRDLKTENVLLSGDGHVRLADFGLSKYLPPSDPLTNTICGTHTFASVEMLAQRHYGKSPDLWALGVFAFYLLNGRTPFEAADLDRVIQKLNKRVIRFRSSTSPEFVSLVKRLLDWQPNTRLGCGPDGWKEVREHPFFAGVDWNFVGSRSVHDIAAEAARRTKAEKESSPSPERNAARPAEAAASTDEVTTPVRGGARSVAGSDSSLPGSPVTPTSTVFGNAPRPSNGSALGAPGSVRVDGGARDERGNGRHVDVEDELRNFDVGLWRETVSIDSDVDDDNCERYLWPIRNAKRPLLDPHYVVGFNFSTPSRL